MELNMFAEEQLEILRKWFQEHDFTQTVPLNMSYEDMTPKQAGTTEGILRLISGLMGQLRGQHLRVSRIIKANKQRRNEGL